MQTRFQRLLMLAALIAVSAVDAGAETLRMNTLLFGERNSAVRATREVFVPEVAKGTEGRHTVQFFFNGELGGQNETVQQIRDGAMFGTILSTAWFSSFVPDLGVASLPFLFPNRETAFRVFDGPLGDELAKKLDAAGFAKLGYMELGFRHLSNAVRPVHTPDDIKGLKIRLQADPVHMDTFRMLGANPIQIAGPELFASLRQGVADGQENPLGIISSMKMYEANQKFVTETGHFFDVFAFVGSKRVMDRMTSTDRAAIMEAARKATLEQRKLATEDDNMGRAELQKNGVSVIQLTPAERAAFQKATEPMYDKIKQRLDPVFVDRFVNAVRQ